jgi:hypothetical protein
MSNFYQEAKGTYCKIRNGKYTQMIFPSDLLLTNEEILNHHNEGAAESLDEVRKIGENLFSFTFGKALITIFDFRKDFNLFEELRFLTNQDQLIYTHTLIEAMINKRIWPPKENITVDKQYSRAELPNDNLLRRNLNNQIEEMIEMVEKSNENRPKNTDKSKKVWEDRWFKEQKKRIGK